MTLLIGKKQIIKNFTEIAELFASMEQTNIGYRESRAFKA